LDGRSPLLWTGIIGTDRKTCFEKSIFKKKNSELVEIAVYGKNSAGIVLVLLQKRGGSFNEWLSEFE
jgi:hypothetical protein